MGITIYRKYRPQTFEDLIGQEYIKQTLQNEIKTGKISHAYIFSGPRGVGKTTLARVFAKSINCENRKENESEPCGKCSSCEDIARGKSLDLVEVDAASNRGINEIRELRERTRFAPSKSKYKVFIVDEVHMLTTEAFNALLKTLEEPPEYIVFILCTTEIHKVPETIISRCQRFDFKTVDIKKITERLEKIVKAEDVKVEKNVLKNIAYYSEGHPRDAESLLAQVLALVTDDKKIGLEQLELILPSSDFDLVLSLIRSLVKNKVQDAIMLINKLIEEGIDLKHFMADLIEMLRKIMLAKIGLNKLSLQMESSIEKDILELAKDIEPDGLIKMIELFMESKREIDYYTIPQLSMEIAVLKICQNNGEELRVDDSGIKDVENNKNIESNEDVKKVRLVRLVRKAEEQNDVLPIQPAQIIKKEKKVRKDGDSVLSLDVVKNKWSEVLTEAGKDNRSLVVLLQTARVISVDKNNINLAFPFKFHLERIKEKKSKDILENALEIIFRQKIKVIPVLQEKIVDEPKIVNEPKEELTSGSVNKLLEAFGGEMVS